MYAIYMDEAGCGGKDQRFYAVSAVLLEVSQLPLVYKDLRSQVAALGIPFQKLPLGHGFEIKASLVARDKGQWKGAEAQRNSVRDLFLGAPTRYGGTAVVVVIEKDHHAKRKQQYGMVTECYADATTWLFERVQSILHHEDDHGLCIYDQAKKRDDTLQQHAIRLFREGSQINFFSQYTGYGMSQTLHVDRILDFTFARSENSVGLIIADFFATFAYHWNRLGHPLECGWWQIMRSSLWRHQGKLKGYGYKGYQASTVVLEASPPSQGIGTHDLPDSPPPPPPVRY